MPEEKCPCCPNHCDKDNLSCNRGREYFKGSNHKNDTEDSVINKIRECGHLLHHNDKDLNSHFLTEEEKQKLISLLDKCLNNWQN